MQIKTLLMPQMDAPEELAHNLPFDPPSKTLVRNITQPYRLYFQPQYFGLENVSKENPALYVNNHAVYGLFDGVVFGADLYLKKDIFLRSLVDNLHFEIPIWRDTLRMVAGGVLGTRRNCEELMRQKEHILVYPGGGREVCKKKDEEYKLTWKNRLGFARMAIEFGYPIVPVAALGTDDVYKVLYDSDDIMNSSLGKYLREYGFAQKFFKDGEHVPPIVRGIGPTLLPKPQKFYFKFGKAIDTTRFEGKFEDEKVLWQLRNEVEQSMYDMIAELKEIRANDKDVPTWRRILNAL